MNYTELSVTVHPREPYTEILISSLEDLPFDTFEETATGFRAWTGEGSVTEEEIRERLYQFDGVEVTHTLTAVEKQNWNELWESSFMPVILPGKVAIRADFHKPVEGVEHEIVITPKMSFGTGHHQTTWLMIRHLTETEVRDKAVLDMGCGTGVLGILACRMGAASVTGTDIDEWAVINAGENLVSNGCSGKMEVLRGDIDTLENRRFNVILANINRNVLLRHLPLYATMLEPGGKLLMSGIYTEDIPEVRARAEENGLKFITQDTRENWAFLMLSR